MPPSCIAQIGVHGPLWHGLEMAPRREKVQSPPPDTSPISGLYQFVDDCGNGIHVYFVLDVDVITRPEPPGGEHDGPPMAPDFADRSESNLHIGRPEIGDDLKDFHARRREHDVRQSGGVRGDDHFGSTE